MKYKQVKVNLTDEAYEKLCRDAEDLEVTKAEYIRRLLKTSIKKKKNISPENLKLINEVKRIGTNLNQISKNINETNIIHILVLEQIIKIEEDLRELLNDCKH